MKKTPHGYAPEFLDFPEAVRANWEWVCALYAFDHGQPQRLADLMRQGGAIPNELRPAIAKAIAGERHVKTKGQDKLALSIDDRMELAMQLSVRLAFSKHSEIQQSPDGSTHLERLADARGTEVIEEKQRMRLYRRLATEKVAERFHISTETLEKMLREIRDLAKKYPDV